MKSFSITKEVSIDRYIEIDITLEDVIDFIQAAKKSKLNFVINKILEEAQETNSYSVADQIKNEALRELGNRLTINQIYELI